MQIRQRIFNYTDMQIMHFILDESPKPLTYYTPFYYQSLQKLSHLRNSPVFWPTQYIVNNLYLPVLRKVQNRSHIQIRTRII